MEDAAVGNLLQNLMQLRMHHYHLISGVEDQVENLEKELHIFKSFLSDTAKTRRKNEILQELARQIRDVVFEAEDLIDDFVSEAAAAEQSMSMKPEELRGVVQNFDSVSRKIKDIYDGNSRIESAEHDLGYGDPKEFEAPPIRQVDMVGFEDEAAMLIGCLTEKTEYLDVISIIGMPGLGKTTLAGKIFQNPEIEYEFPIRIWVNVSSEFERKNVFLAILKQLKTNLVEDKNDGELAEEIAAQLKRKKFLIVMDDVWEAEDWEKLQIAFPRHTNAGKVLITSRNLEVGRYANCIRYPHMLRLLTREESSLLLCLEALGKREFPIELEVLGNLIADQCDGLPLAIVVIGGILLQKRDRKNAWEKVAMSVATYLNEDPRGRMENIISLSYYNLPYHLKPCFLYFGIFPEDFEIPVWKLIRMWIAEGFIEEKGGIVLEEIAENYLEELINYNLVRIEKMASNGRVKTCVIHDMLREFCRTEAGNRRENFIQEIRKSTDGGHCEPPASDLQNCRRLYIQSSILDFFSSEPYLPRARSFLCFPEYELALEPEETSLILEACKLLRVLDFNSIRFTRFPLALTELIHLRYIVLSTGFKVLPEDVSKLWNLQTLWIDTTSRTLEMKADLCNMIQLRHLKTNASIILRTLGGKYKDYYGSKLQTLSNLSPESCTEGLFNMTSNLKKLGIRGRLATLLDHAEDGYCAFDNFVQLSCLENLKLLNDVFPSPPLEGQLHGLPPLYKFPPNLRSLTLSYTFLDWSHMSTLGLLENLQVLKLKDKAFMGKRWETVDGGFCRLEVLRIGWTDLAFWGASGDHFPRLRRLELRNCEELQQIPIGLADIPSFQLLDLYLSKNAATSAKKIQAIKQNQEEQYSQVSKFKLSIFPRDE